MVPADIPDTIPKTPRMKLLEYKYSCRLEKELFSGSLNDIERRFKGEVDRSTLSRWRKYFTNHISTILTNRAKRLSERSLSNGN
jgi:hypothetical protein